MNGFETSIAQRAFLVKTCLNAAHFPLVIRAGLRYNEDIEIMLYGEDSLCSSALTAAEAKTI